MFVFLLWFKEAFLGLFRNFWWNAVALILSLVCLTAFSISIAAGDNAGFFSNQINKKLEIQVEIKDKQTNYDEMKRKLEIDNRISSVSFFSKEQANQQVKKDLGQGVLDIVGSNFLPAKFVVKVKDANEIEKIANDISKYQFVQKTRYGKEFINNLLTFTGKLKTYGFYASIGVAIFVIFIVMFVIRMNIEQRKDEIRIKQLIGSSMFTIRMPFVLEAVMLMAISSGVTYFLFKYLYSKLEWFVSSKFPSLSIVSGTTMLDSLTMPLFGAALVLGVFGSFFAANRHLKRL